MLGNAQVLEIIRPSPSWPSKREFTLGVGLASEQVRQTDSLAPSRQALIEGFRQWTGAARPGLGPVPGQLLAFRTRERRRPAGAPRNRELAWRRAHAEELRALAGRWVILEGEVVVGSGPDPALLVAEARRRGIEVPYIFFVEPCEEDTAKLGI